MVRAALKEAPKAKAMQRETIFYRGTKWAEGKPGESGEYREGERESARRRDGRLTPSLFSLLFLRSFDRFHREGGEIVIGV